MEAALGWGAITALGIFVVILIIVFFMILQRARR